ncbi:MAG: hypothetical protein II695_10080, partial [Oscillospiraceae bacterium]|nr:hypothetical protein [Oscillospiraceae bacterium]
YWNDRLYRLEKTNNEYFMLYLMIYDGSENVNPVEYKVGNAVYSAYVNEYIYSDTDSKHLVRMIIDKPSWVQTTT